MSRSQIRSRILSVLFFFSGAAGLGYQMAWIRMFSTGLGHEMPAALAIVAMGATLPAMERFVSPLVSDGRCVGAIYAANTLGAVAGTLLTAFAIVPAIGLRASVWGFGAVNLLCGAAALWLAEMADNRH